MDAPGRNNIRVMVPTITIFIWRQNSASWSWQLHGTIPLKHCKNTPHNHNMVRTPGTQDIKYDSSCPSPPYIMMNYRTHSAASILICQSRLMKVFFDSRNTDTAQWLYLLCSSQAAQVSALPSALQSYINIAVATRHPGTTSILLHGATSHHASNLQQNWSLIKRSNLTKLMKACTILLIIWANGESLM